MSLGSKDWWALLVSEAKAAYEGWAQTPAIERASIRAHPSPELGSDKYSRLERRAFSMIHASLPRSIAEELLAERTLDCLSTVFLILKTFQPGGLQERSRLIEALCNPGIGASRKDVVDKLRSWTRHYTRAASMGVSIPDPSVLMKGIDMLSSAQLSKHHQVSFRMSVVRTRLTLDHSPAHATVKDFAQALQSEFAMLAIAGVEDGSGKGPRNARISKFDAQEDEGKGAGKGGGNTDSKQKACMYWFTKGGCKWGQKCRYLHEQPVAKDSGRCYRCSGEGHSKSTCPYKEAGGSKSSAEASRAEVPGSKAKGKAAARKAQAAEPGVGSESTPGAGTAPDAMASGAQASSAGGQSQAQTDLLREATEALKSLALRAMRKAKKWVKDELDFVSSVAEGSLCPPGMVLKVAPKEGGKTGLLDSGASVCLRTGTALEHRRRSLWPWVPLK